MTLRKQIIHFAISVLIVATCVWLFPKSSNKIPRTAYSQKEIAALDSQLASEDRGHRCIACGGVPSAKWIVENKYRRMIGFGKYSFSSSSTAFYVCPRHADTPLKQLQDMRADRGIEVTLSILTAVFSLYGTFFLVTIVLTLCKVKIDMSMD